MAQSARLPISLDQHHHSIPQLEAKDIFACNPAEVVDIALSHLQNAGTQLIEWRALLQRRMNVPRCVNVYLPTFFF